MLHENIVITIKWERYINGEEKKMFIQLLILQTQFIFPPFSYNTTTRDGNMKDKAKSKQGRGFLHAFLKWDATV